MVVEAPSGVLLPPHQAGRWEAEHPPSGGCVLCPSQYMSKEGGDIPARVGDRVYIFKSNSFFSLVDKGWGENQRQR